MLVVVSLSVCAEYSFTFIIGLFEIFEFTVDLEGSIKFFVVGPIYKRLLAVKALI